MLTLIAGFVWLVGLSVGSFLNVVIYRLPLGLSISDPLWSFCPSCRHTLRWFDNIPVLSWLLLRGRCRYCRTPISPRYPLVESLTGLVFVLTFALIFVIRGRVDLDDPLLPRDAAFLLAWLTLAAALLACSAMDLVSYMIDTRVTNAAFYAGIVLHALWPRSDFLLPTAGTPWAAAAVAALLVGGAMLWIAAPRQPGAANEPPADSQSPQDTASAEAAPPPRSHAAVAIVAVATFVLLAAWLIGGTTGAAPPGRVAIAPCFVAIFAAMALTGGQPRAADHEIHAAIEQERPQARRLVLGELLWLLPSVVAAAVVFAFVANVPAATDAWRSATGWSPVGHFVPIAGVAYALFGAAAGAALGWTVRIVFTLVLGREAFGVGDIFILTAAGACVGWDLVLLGFFLGVGIALLGWLVGLALKRSVMIPFGPPLALGFLAALWLNVPAVRVVRFYVDGLTAVWRQRPAAGLLIIGVLLAGMVLAVVAARAVRRFLEPPGGPGSTQPA